MDTLKAGLAYFALVFGAGFLLATVRLPFLAPQLIQDRPLAEYVASRDPVSGTAYLVMLGVFALMPALLLRHRRRNGGTDFSPDGAARPPHAPWISSTP